MQPVANRILARMRGRPGYPFQTRGFLGLGTRAAIDQALMRLVRQEKIRRIGRGLYEFPRVSKLLQGPVAPSPDALVRAWAEKNGQRIVPSGAQAANLLGLSTQVPAKITYYTNGRTKTLALGPYSVKLLNRGPKTMDVTGRMAPMILQALRHLGRQGCTQEVAERLRLTLSPRDKSELASNLRYVTAWMKPVIDRITAETAS